MSIKGCAAFLVLAAWPVIIAVGLWRDYHSCDGHRCNLWQDVANKSPYKPRALINAGMSARKAGNPDKAEAYFERAIHVTPKNGYDAKVKALAETNLAYIYIERGEYQHAFDLTNAAMAAPSLETFNAMALLVLIGQQPEEALRLTDEILEQGGGAWRLRPSVWSTRGQALQMLGRCDEAQAAYVTIKSLKPDFDIPACP